MHDLKFDIMNNFHIPLYTLLLFSFSIIYKSQKHQYDLLESIALLLVYVFLGFKISSGIYSLKLLYSLPPPSEREYLYPNIKFKTEFKKLLRQCCCFVLVVFPMCYILERNVYMEFFTAIAILIAIFINFNPSKNEVLEENELNIGYGAALSYYKNYLELFLPHKFEERIQAFKSYNQVDVENKLFILVPESCRVLQYIDKTDDIERCQELPKLCINHGGVKDRVYNITVYLINCNNNNNNRKKLRMAVEYAQPLKGLYNLKEKQIISEEEMYHERKLFVKCLKEFLRDGNDSYKFCTIVEFNDAIKEVAEALLESCNSNVYFETV